MDKFEPDWSKAPDWSNYFAIDGDGEMFWYGELPSLDGAIWLDNDLADVDVQFAGYCEESFDCTVLHKRPNTLFEDLKESLEEALEIKEGRREPSRVTAIQTKDSINPSHYKNGKVECIDAIESATVGKTGLEAVCTANVTKYLWRYETKNGLEDVKKAQWYLNRLVEHLESKES